MDENPPSRPALGPGAWIRALLTAVAGSAVLWFAGRHSGAEGLFGDAYSHVIYWHDLLAGHAGRITPTITTPKPLAVVVTGMAWDAGGGLAGVRLTWAVLGGVALSLIWRVAEILSAGAAPVSPEGGRAGSTALAGLLATLLATHWMMQVPLVFEARTALLAALPLLVALERALVRHRLGIATGVAVGLAGLVRPEPWVLAGVWALAAFGARVTRRNGKRVSLVAPLLALSAPLVWCAWDLAVFGDPLFSRQLTAHWQEVLRPGGLELSLPETLAGIVGWTRAAIGRFGAGFFLLALVGVGVSWSRRRAGVAAFFWGAWIWVATILGLGLAGYTSSHRFLDPLMLVAWAPAGVALAAALGSLPRRRSATRVVAAGVLAAVILALAAGAFDQHRALARRFEQPVVAIRSQLRDLFAEMPSRAERAWLIDNDLGSRLALETPLDPARVVTLQAAPLEELEKGDWAGLILDDRLQPRRHDTPEARAVAARAARGRVRYRGSACALITLDE